jgi:hypothetical protein
MKDFWNTVFRNEEGRLKQGHEYHVLHNVYNASEMGIILRWRDGKLHDDGDLPAVEFQDTHTEHYRNGLLHNDKTNSEGKIRPAIISGYGTRFESYINGKEIV